MNRGKKRKGRWERWKEEGGGKRLEGRHVQGGEVRLLTSPALTAAVLNP